MAENSRMTKTLESSRRASTSVYILISPCALLLDLAGIAEPLRLANQFALERYQWQPFDLRMVGASYSSSSSLPLTLTGQLPLPEQLQASTVNPAWVVIVGVTGADKGSAKKFSNENARIQHWLKSVVKLAVADKTAKVLTVCGGALIAAKAGLLDGRRCTTHHELIAQLRHERPQAIVEDDRIFVIDGLVATSAGITAGIDLSLAAINQHCGPAIASAVARDLVVYWRRAGGDPQLSPFIEHRNHIHPAVHRAQDAIIAKPHAQWDSDSIAKAACVSQRHIRRLFTEHAQVTPIAYVNRIRIALARQILQSEPISVEEVATRVGYGSARYLREAWRRNAEGSPSLSRRSGIRHHAVF
jgi:transcriptional regulator GlxA family with amidase domain